MAGVQLEGADLRAANLRDANFTGAKLQGVEAHMTDFRGCDLRLANLGGAYLDGALLPPPQGAGLSAASVPTATVTAADKQRLPSPAEIADRKRPQPAERNHDQRANGQDRQPSNDRGTGR